MNILGKKSIAQSARASVSNGQRLHISKDIVGEKKVMYDTISKTSSKTSGNRTCKVSTKQILDKCIINESGGK